jgi:hypothetical protein
MSCGGGGYEQLYPVLQEGKWGYIDIDGNMVIEPRFDEAYEFSEGLAGVNINGKYGYIDDKGNVAIEARWDSYSMDSSFKEGMAVVELDGSYGYIDKSGDVVVEPQFDDPPGAFSGQNGTTYY